MRTLTLNVLLVLFHACVLPVLLLIVQAMNALASYLIGNVIAFIWLADFQRVWWTLFVPMAVFTLVRFYRYEKTWWAELLELKRGINLPLHTAAYYYPQLRRFRKKTVHPELGETPWYMLVGQLRDRLEKERGQLVA